jgi:hypothetical protein
MIVGSLLLILVAVTMLILGLAAGSSALLIGSIAASLLAAVALVVGARQAAAARAEARGPSRSPLAVDLDDDPGPATAVFHDGAQLDDGPLLPDGRLFDDGPLLDDSASRRRSGENAYAGERFGDDRRDDGWSSVAVADPDTDPGVDVSARSADTEILHTGRPVDAGKPFDAGTTPFGNAFPAADDRDASYDRPADDGFAAWSGPDPGDHEPVTADQHGYDERDLPDPAQAGRDDVLAEMTAHPVVPASPADPMHPDQMHPDQMHPDQMHPDRPGGGEVPADARAAEASGVTDPVTAGSMSAESMDDLDEDPADEPLPQRVQPTDAVRVSRMTVDVLVVDGRPRYHLAECPHLDGKESEPIPVGEAVDLGFTACGLCRPVDALVAEASRR